MPTFSSRSSTRVARLLVRHPAVNLQHFAHLLLDRVQRIERGHRLLEDHRDLVAPDVAERARIEGQEVHAVEADAARRVRRGGVGQEPQDRQRRHRLARARFADERHGLGLADIEGHIADGVGDGISAAEIDRQILDRYQGVVCLATSQALALAGAASAQLPRSISMVAWSRPKRCLSCVFMLLTI